MCTHVVVGLLREQKVQSLFRNIWRNSLSSDTNCSDTLRNWIADKASLTANVKQLCKGQFSVRVLKHDLTTTPEFAAEELGVPAGSELLHREVLLCDDDTPLVFACSLLPGAALTGRFAEIRTLGARPLGHWIFPNLCYIVSPCSLHGFRLIHDFSTYCPTPRLRRRPYPAEKQYSPVQTSLLSSVNFFCPNCRRKSSLRPSHSSAGAYLANSSSPVQFSVLLLNE